MAVHERPAVRQDHVPDRVLTRDDLEGGAVFGCDVAIVGSGAGGAVLAAELAEDGLDVLVLEEGRYFSTRDFTAEATAMVRALYRDGGATVALGRPPVLYQEGSAVGGTTVVNGGMAWRPPERVLDRWQREEGLERIQLEEMEPYFERVERRIHVRTQDQETVSRDHELLRRGAERKGWKLVDNPRNQVHCSGSNNCAFGCPTGAKQSALVSYIPRALHFGARVLSDVRVARILRRGKRAVGVEGHVVRADKSRGDKVTVHADLVVSAGGAVQTPALLHRSGFRSPSGRLGRDLALHPNGKVVALFDEPVRAWEGVHQAYQVKEFQDEGIGALTTINVPPAVVAMSLPRYGAELASILDQYENLVVAGCMVEDTSTGRIRFGPGGYPMPTYQISDYDFSQVVRGVKMCAELMFEAGARKVLLPFGSGAELRSADELAKLDERSIKKESAEIVTVHIMGTARIGGDRSRAVCDGYGRVYDADRLVVCDASLLPSALGVNPALTIQALATRVAHHILENRRSHGL